MCNYNNWLKKKRDKQLIKCDRNKNREMEGGKELLIAAEIILALTLFIIHALSSSDNE